MSDKRYKRQTTSIAPCGALRRGGVLLIVLVAVVILSLAGYAFALLMRIEDEASRMLGRRVQSKYLVDSAVDYTRMVLANDQATLLQMGGVHDNASLFFGQMVSVDPDRPDIVGRFSVVAPALDPYGFPAGMRFGLTDESTKLNLNVLTFADQWIPGAARELLMALPNMTPDIADAILDWIDPDDEPREYGVPSSYYLSGNPPYVPRNGPLDSLEELLLVRGVTPELLFGLDLNRNGILDAEELASPQAGGVPPELLLGWANYLTLYSKEANLTQQGLQRVYINSPDLIQLYNDLRATVSESWAQFIIAYRQFGPYSGTEEPPSRPELIDLDLELEPSFNFTQVLDLVDAMTAVEDPLTGELTVLMSPIQSVNLDQTIPAVMENLTTMQGMSIPGRINIMQAPMVVMQGIPGMTPELLEAILNARADQYDPWMQADPNRQFETWLLVEGLVDLQTMRTLLPFICVGGDVYHAELVGFFDDGVGTSRAEVILDTTEPLPRILFWRDKSHLPVGIPLETLGAGFGYGF